MSEDLYVDRCNQSCGPAVQLGLCTLLRQQSERVELAQASQMACRQGRTALGSGGRLARGSQAHSSACGRLRSLAQLGHRCYRSGESSCRALACKRNQAQAKRTLCQKPSEPLQHQSTAATWKGPLKIHLNGNETPVDTNSAAMEVVLSDIATGLQCENDANTWRVLGRLCNLGRRLIVSSIKCGSEMNLSIDPRA
jgi:hypothetical protein